MILGSVSELWTRNSEVSFKVQDKVFKVEKVIRQKDMLDARILWVQDRRSDINWVFIALLESLSWLEMMDSVGTNYRHSIIVKTPIFWSFSKLEFYLLYYYPPAIWNVSLNWGYNYCPGDTVQKPTAWSRITIGNVRDKSQNSFSMGSNRSDNIGDIINDAGGNIIGLDYKKQPEYKNDKFRGWSHCH